MGRYILRRLLIAVPVVIGITVITFSLANLAPGNPVDAMIDPNQPPPPPMELEKMKQQLGLDKPVPVRYVIWVGQLLRGNLGYSYITNRSVVEMIAEKLPQTVVLMATAWTLSLVIGIALGIYSAFHQYSHIDNGLTFLVFAGISVPAFFFALLAIYFFAFRIPIFPTIGMNDPASTWNPLLDRLYHLVLPALVLGIDGTAGYLRYTRASVLDVMRQDYVNTARAKGLAERAVRVGHVFRNALLPLVTIAGMHLPALIGGSLFVEMLFSWPGMGRLAISATLNRDYTLMMGICLVSATMVVLANLIADITYAVVDPRIRYA